MIQFGDLEFRTGENRLFTTIVMGFVMAILKARFEMRHFPMVVFPPAVTNINRKSWIHIISSRGKGIGAHKAVKYQHRS